MGELVDTYDENLNFIEVRDRDDAHALGLWHKAFHCWIVSKRDGVDYVLFQLRSADKSLFPNMLDITAAGHLTAGESTQDGLRELEEELGVKVDFEKLTPLGIRTEVVRIGDVINREFDDTFLLRDDRDITEFLLQEEEVTGLVEVPVGDGLRLFGGEIDSVSVRATRLENGETVELSVDLTREDVIPRTDRYYLKVFIMAERYFDGNRFLAI